MSYENSAGLNVSNHYGSRDSGKTIGVVKTEGVMQELKINVDAAMMDAEAYPLVVPTLPAGAIIDSVYAKVTEVFIFGGTTPTILIGTETSEVTNGLVMSEAQAEALGSYDLTGTLTGTWGAPLAADTILGLAHGGSSPTNGATGKVDFVIRYAVVGAAG